MKTLREHVVGQSETTVRLHRRADGSFTVSQQFRKRLSFTEYQAKAKAEAEQHFQALVSATKKD